MPIRLALPGLMAALAAAPALAAGDDPLSAIDWLSESVTAPPATPAAAPVAMPNEPPVSKGGALPADVATTPLDAASPDAVGLIAPAVSGLPRDLWGAGRSEEIGRAITADRMDSLPALRQLFLTMLLAEAMPPADAGTGGRLLQLRIDKLLALGALEQAAALIDIAGADTPDLFRRAFDIALLTGDESRACETMQASPGLAPTFQARIFCLARAGEWDAAALTLQTAAALGQVSEAQADLLARFLDPDLAEGAPMLPPPSPVTPLDWKIYEAIGETLPTSSLPVAFAYAEIGETAGWKAQIEAAERLTRAGTIAPNVLLGLYTQRDAAASGGVWDRVVAFQDFDAALRSRDPDRVAQTLPPVWARMQEVELEVPFALLFGRQLAQVSLTGEAAAIAFRVGLLSPDYETIARTHPPADATERFLTGLATGKIENLIPPDSMGRAISPAFLSPAPSEATRALIQGDRFGEALLMAIEEVARGVEGNLQGVTQGLSLLRMVRLEGVARRTALQLMILERRG
jgi:hypothetical protein